MIAALVLAATGARASGEVPAPVQCLSQRVTSDMSAQQAAEVRRARLAEALEGGGFGVQYWGQTYDAGSLESAPHGLLVMEAARIGAPFTDNRRELYFDAPELARIRADGARPVIGYLNVGEVEPYRDYWAEEVRAAFGAASETRPVMAWSGPVSKSGELLSRYWTPEWEAVALRRVDRMMALGYDGILLDDVLHYYTMAAGALRDPGAVGAAAPTDAAGYARAMMQLVTRIADRARATNCDAIIIVNNGAYIGRDAGPDPAGWQGPPAFDRYREAIDGLLIESLFAPNANPEAVDVLRADYQAAGIRVMTVDFASYFPDQSPDDVRAAVSARAAEAGFAPYVADNAGFDRLYPPVTGSELSALRK